MLNKCYEYKDIIIIYSNHVEETLNCKGYTLGEEAGNIEAFCALINYLNIQGVYSDEQAQRILNKLHDGVKKIIKEKE